MGTCRRSPLSANAQEYPGRERDTLPVPQTPLVRTWRGSSRPPALGFVACTGLLVARPWWVRPALGEKFAFSSYLRKGCVLTIPEGFLPHGPLGCPPRTAFLRAAFALSRLPRPAPPRSEFEEGSRGAELVDPPLCGALSGELFLVAGGGEGPRTHPRARYPPSPRGLPLDGEVGRVAVGSRSHPPPVSPPCLLSRASLSQSRPRLGLSRGAGVPRVVRAVCSRACAVVASPPLPRQRSHGWWNRGSPPPLPGALEGPCLAGLTSLSGADSFGGTAVGPRPARRRTSGPAAARGSSSAGTGVCIGPLSCWRLLGLPGGSAGPGSARRRRCGGTAPGSCVQCDSRRYTSRARSPPEGSPGPLLRRLPREAAAAVPAGRRPSFCRVVPPPRPPVALISLSPRPAGPRPCCRTPPARWGSRARTGRGPSPGRLGGRAARQAGEAVVWRASRPPRPWRGVSRGVWRLCAGGKLPREEKEGGLAVVAPPVGGFCWPRCVWGARSGPAALRGGVRWGTAGVPRWAPGRRDEPARVSRCGGGGSGRCLFPPLPEARPPSAGSAPLVPPSRGLKSPVDLLPSSSVSRATTRPRVHGGSVLFLRFSPGVGRRPVSRRSPSVWSLSRPFAVLRLRPEGSRGSPFPRRCASLCRVLGGARCGSVSP